MPRPVSVMFAVSLLGLLAGPASPQGSQSNAILPPAIDQAGRVVAFGTAIEPNGTRDTAADAWLWSAGEWFTGLHRLTNYASTPTTNGVTALTLSPDGSQVAYVVLASGSSQAEEVHLIDASGSPDRLLTRDTQGCVQPALACPNLSCYLPCVHEPHITPDGSVLYATSRNQPFWVVTAAGKATQLPTYSGSLAAGPQRVVSSSGSLVFVSSAPSGPTFAAAATDAYLMNLDGTGLRNLTHFPTYKVYAQNAVISADGRTIVFESNYGLGDAREWPQIFTINSDGTGLRQLTSGPAPASNPSLSADGSFVAFAQSGQISLSHTNGSVAPAPLTAFHYSTAGDPVLSDDGSRVAFTIGPPGGGRGAIYQVSVADGAATPVYAPISLNTGGALGVAGNELPSPGSLVSIYGMNFTGDQMTVANVFPLPQTLAGISVEANGRPLPLSSVTPWQINAQLPQDTPVKNTVFQISTASAAGNTLTASVEASAPAVFAFSTPNGWQAAAFHARSAIPADAQHPATAGETLETYGSGLGLTTPSVAAGDPSPASPPATASAVPQVTIGGQPAEVTFAGLAPGLAGVYQMNVIVPAGLAPGPQRLVWKLDNRDATIFVK